MSAHASRSRAAPIAVRVAAAYLLLGAVAKAGWGAPDDLPAVLRENAHGDLTVLFQLVVGVELLTALTALIAPRLGWPVLATLLLGFFGILVQQVTAGASSCGCFGSSVSVPPWLMLVVDGLVLGAMLATRPWTTLRDSSWRPWAPAVGSVAAIAAGLYIGAGAATPPPPAEDADAIATPTPGTDTPSIEPARGTPSPPAPRVWRLPEQFPRFVVLAPEQWVGERLRFTPLATWADVSKFPDDATLVFFYDTCDRCKKHIEGLVEAATQAEGETRFVFLQLPTKLDNRHPRLIHELPPGLHVRLPAGTRWIIETPWDVTIENGVVTAAHAGF